MLSSGTKLGTHEITSHIGSGGMGEVYQAHDSKLDRDVAIKVLPEQFARDSERLARFQREAKMLAALNHPNIAAIYGLEQSGSTHYLVMELVPGETLRERTAGDRPVPVEESLTIAKQIAEALEAAHGSEKGIIHRDLKPANVKVTPEGRVKVLDFGLAKAFAADAATDDPSNSPTLSVAPTMQGLIMGTAAYMSPEQARGKQVTKATDIFAFGAVLYELLAGKQAFQGEDVPDILAAVVRTEPDWTRLPEATPPAIRTLLRRCLKKDRRQRLQDATDVRIEIEDVLSGAASAEPAAAQGAPALSRRALLWGAVCVVAASLVTGLAVWSLRPAPPPQPVSRVVIPLPPDEQLRGSNFTMVALSTDGTQLAYIAGGAQYRIYLRALDSMDARPLAGTEGAVNPFFSPDGQWIGFFAAGKLKKVSISGGAVLTLCDAAAPRGAAWGANDTIIFAPTPGAGLSQVSAAGGAPQVLTKLKEGENSHRWPQFLPDGKTILYTSTIGGSSDDAHIAVQRLDTGEQRVLTRGGTYARYVPTGHLVYYRAGTIMAAPFDAARLEVLGTPSPVAEGVMSATANTGAGEFSFSSLGSLVYVPGGSQAGERTLVWVDRRGTETPLPAPPRGYDDLSLSPDGRQVAVQIADPPPGSVWIYDIPRGTSARLTFEGTTNLPSWTPEGKRIVYAVIRPGANGIGLSWKPADGSGAEERLMTSEFPPGASSVSSDGKEVAFYGPGPSTGNDIWILPLQEERKPRPFLQTPFSEVAPAFSPDGRWLAYTSNESGRNEIYVQPYPGPGGKWLISTDGGTEPVWSRNGRELFYRNGDKLMAVDIQTQPAFKAGTPRMLFERPGYQVGTRPDYDVAPDGQRFLMIKHTEQQQSALTQIHVVLNWFEELKRRVPTPQ